MEHTYEEALRNVTTMACTMEQSEIESFLSEKDREVIEKAKEMDWEYIEEGSAETELGNAILHKIIMRKYHEDEASCGMI